MPDGSAQHPDLHPALAKRGRLDLSFARDPNGRSFIDRQFSSYPFHICRPFYLDTGPCKGMATVYTQSCSGGLYTQDRVAMEMEVGDGAQAHLTSQASTIVHASTDGPTHQICRISAGADSLVEYTPDPVILFPMARLRSEVKVTLHETANAILFDSFLAHDYRGGDGVFDYFHNDIRLRDTQGQDLAIDCFELQGADFQVGGCGQMGAHGCHGSVIVVAPELETGAFIDGARTVLADFDGCFAGISQLPLARGFSARILASDPIPMKKAMLALWAFARRSITGKDPGIRRK